MLNEVFGSVERKGLPQVLIARESWSAPIFAILHIFLHSINQYLIKRINLFSDRIKMQFNFLLSKRYRYLISINRTILIRGEQGGYSQNTPLWKKFLEIPPCPAKLDPLLPPSSREARRNFFRFFKGICWKILCFLGKFRGFFGNFGEFSLNLTGFS